jgi:phenylpropionate dioxygenase-like ring-hydroxylating dioxygenase large terminal subunit
MSPYPEKLKQCWHPVAYADQVVGTEPYGTKLLDKAVVLWRSSDGEAHAMRDLCIHRGTALSLGVVRDDSIVCPYHGWRYDRSGDCILIPQSEHTSIPTKARTPVYQCQERYGLIWVCLGDAKPSYELPAIPEFGSEDWRFVNTGPFPWMSDASRQVENFTDFGHFPWVHPGLLGDPARPMVPDYQVETDGHILRYEIVRPEAPNSDEFPVFANETEDQPVRHSRYELSLPYSIVLRSGWGGDKRMVYIFASQPLSQNECQGYCIVGRNYNFDEPDTVIKGFEDVIFGQDQRIVESQRPEQVPFDLADELHLKFDAVAINYRRAMDKEQLAYWPLDPEE